MMQLLLLWYNLNGNTHNIIDPESQELSPLSAVFIIHFIKLAYSK